MRTAGKKVKKVGEILPLFASIVVGGGEMISPITWLWNMRHRELIEETKALVRLYQFLRHDCGLQYADRLSAKEIRELLKAVKGV